MHHPNALSRYPLSLFYVEPGQVVWELIKAVVEVLKLIRLLCRVLPLPLSAELIVSDLYKAVWCGWMHHKLNNRCLSAAQAVPINQELPCNVHPVLASAALVPHLSQEVPLQLWAHSSCGRAGCSRVILCFKPKHLQVVVAVKVQCFSEMLTWNMVFCNLCILSSTCCEREE